MTKAEKAIWSNKAYSLLLQAQELMATFAIHKVPCAGHRTGDQSDSVVEAMLGAIREIRTALWYIQSFTTKEEETP